MVVSSQKESIFVLKFLSEEFALDEIYICFYNNLNSCSLLIISNEHFPLSFHQLILIPLLEETSDEISAKHLPLKKEELRNYSH